VKVKQLIDWLSGEDQDAEVHIAYNYGDRNRTMVAPSVSRIEEDFIKDSDYFRMPTIVEDDEEASDLDNDPSVRRAVIIFARS